MKVSNGPTNYAVTALDRNGFALSTTSGKTRIDETTTIHLALKGIPAQIALLLAGSPRIGTASALPITISAYDAAGALIVGNDAYDVPIRLGSSDLSGTFRLSDNSVASPAAKVFLRYSGGIADTILKATPKKPAIVQTVAVYPSAAVHLYHVGSNAFGGDYFVPGSLTKGQSGYLAIAYPSGFATITANGRIAHHPSSLSVNAVTVGPDGAYWLARSQCEMPGECPTNYVSRFAGSAYTDYAVSAEITSIVSGPNGQLWGLAENPETVFSITSGGVVQTFAVTNTWNIRESNIVAAADGNLWFYDRAGNFSNNYNRFVIVAPDGSMTELKVKGTDAPNIAPAAGGKLLWLAESGSGGIGQMTISTKVFRSFSGFPVQYSGNVIPIAADSKGNAWLQVQRPPVAQPYEVFVAVVKWNGSATYVRLPSSKELTEVTSLCLADDGTLWFASDTAVGTIDLGGS